MAECSGYSGPAFCSIAKIRVKGSSDDRQTAELYCLMHICRVNLSQEKRNGDMIS